MADPFSPEQLEALTTLVQEKIGPAVNNMFTARLKTETSKIEKQFKDAFESNTRLLEEKLSTFKPPAVDPDDKGGGSKGKKDVELESLRKQFSEMQQQLLEQRQIADAEREKNRTVQLNQTVTDKLSALGQIHGTAGKMALGALSAFGRIGWGQDDEADKIVFRGDDGIAVDIDVGLKQWLKTDEAKIFQAPTGVRGSGSRPGGLAPGGNGQLSNDQKAAFLNTLLDNTLP